MGNLNYTDIQNALNSFDTENVIFKKYNGTCEKKLVPKHGYCKLMKVIPNESIKIYLKQELEAVIMISDPSFSSYFQHSDNLMTGDRILTKTKGKIVTEYKLQMKENIRETHDGSCSNYPTARHDKFEDCIANEYEERIMHGTYIRWFYMSKK